MILEIPTNFDANKIPDDVKTISLNCPGRAFSFCNLVKKSAPAFPARSQLISAYFKGFKAEDGGRFPANILLANVKRQIVILDIRNSFIGKLDADYFSGYSALTVLILKDNDLSEIALNTFQELNAQPAVLDTVKIVHCKLSSLDWAVWQPVADSLTNINLADQKTGLATLNRSGPAFSLKNLQTLTLVNNQLSAIPKEVLETINNSQQTISNHTKLILQLQGNPFCPANADCTQCAELTDFFRWICDRKKPATQSVHSIIRYTCGSGAAAKESLITTDRYSYNFSMSYPHLTGMVNINREVGHFDPNCTVHISKP